MTVPFLITGLPRSRTAWMSVVANSVPAALCRHEPIQHLRFWQEALKLWESSSPGAPRWMGISDSSLGFHLEEILDTHRPRTLIIEREVEAVEKSLRNQGIFVEGYCGLLRERISRAYGHPLVRRVRFAALRDPRVVFASLSWLMPNCVVSLAKIEELCRMNVQVDIDLLREAAAASNMDDVLGADIADELRRINNQ